MALPSQALVEEELHRRLAHDPLANWYVPNVYPAQRRFHESRKPYTLLVGGNRGGKTYAAVAEALFYALGRPVFAPVPNPPVVVWYVMPSLTMFRRSILPVFNKLVPRKFVKRKKRDEYFQFVNGSEIHFVSSDMESYRLQGASVDLVIMDEKPDQEVFEELQARVLDRRGRIAVVFAPIENNNTAWVYDNLYLPAINGEREDVDIVPFPIADEDGNPLVGHLTKEDIEMLMKQWPDPAVREARIFGRFAAFKGLVFKNFSIDTHVVKPFDIPPNYSRWAVCDPQYHRFAVLFFAADSEGRVFVTDEYFSQDEHLARRAERLTAMVKDASEAIPIYVDYAVPQDIAELNWHFSRLSSPLSACPLPMPKKTEDFLTNAQALLEPQEDLYYPSITGLGQYLGAPRVLFFSSLQSEWSYGQLRMKCSRLVWELTHLVWGSNGKIDKNSADGADMIDALMYGLALPMRGEKASPRSRFEELPLDKRVTAYLLLGGDGSWQ